MATQNLNILMTLDTDAYINALSSFETAVEASDYPLEIKRAFLDCALHLINKGRAVCLDSVPAPQAREVRVILKPSKALLGLMAAVGAGDDNSILIGGGHG